MGKHTSNFVSLVAMVGKNLNNSQWLNKENKRKKNLLIRLEM